MTDGILGGSLFAVPYLPFIGHPTKNETILDNMVKHPMWFTAALPPDGIRIASAHYLTDPDNLVWEVWLGGTLVGVVILSRITPNVDAHLHFTFFGVSMRSTKKLLWNILGHCFTALDLQRVTYEAPEHAKGLIAFLRKNALFLYEGEKSCQDAPLALLLTNKGAGKYHAANQKDAATWIAKQGSRREAAYWDGTRFRDTVVLRLLKREWELASQQGDEPGGIRVTEGSSPDASSPSTRTA